MSIDLSPAAARTAEALVASGRFVSVAEAVDAALQALLSEEQELVWSADLQQAVDKGVQAAAAGDFASEVELDQLFVEHRFSRA